ncbi:hypothetical protein HF086_016132 [Spodoptera exigua]|uniref:Methylosome subunit pICln n=1 Tax=Spodoptera exigua TaxID=7107 RepID=A0A922MDY2_SPOEX|nr:hypothetical protein HF086_016132 [Spodoptera exigua]
MVVVSPSFSVPAEGILMQLPSVNLIVNNDVDLGTATLYITEHNVVWGGGVGRQGGPSPTVTLMYPNISLHAIQRDPGPGLILVINHELRFVPQNDNDLEAMFMAMNQGQSLHPDPADEIDEDEEDPYMDGEEFDEGEDEFEDAEESNMSAEDAAARLRQMRLENVNGHSIHGRVFY